ncbi:pantoate--beta-alanine ligase [Kushneria phyllosphaerae]|uniref:Pantothenate synthetase n=1 Tax=Kushneria phyllosphaerae TaxID=2100822 RepID=A0A2R8CQY8_9GAMM|nr:pantoate--beta-alanine ligase [Kushneria phyllosphaerae]SPJ35307.1 Pantothenate synthetase [Kushneria phyllosphaerae]
MQTFDDIKALQNTLAAWRREGHRIALVPTMGNLHEGHLRLVDAARQHADRVVATVFVNPLQFGPDEDLDRYPRTLSEDQRLLAGRGCDLLFAPGVDTLYPEGQSSLTRVIVPRVSEGLCGAHRPGHFDGVATVVSLLFNLTRPDVACFGEKDFQQLAVIRKLVRDQHMPIEIIGVPIARDHDGLALSSRNRYLDEEARAQAGRLHQCLVDSAQRLEQGDNSEQVLAKGLQQLQQAGFQPEYLALCDATTLCPISTWHPGAVLLAAARLGNTRLIDNLVRAS